VKIDAVNSTYIYCETTRSKAYFYNDGDIHYFTHFDGDKTSLLFMFYLAAYKVMTGYYRNLTVTDNYPVNTFTNRALGLLQDFAAPFFLFTRSGFTLNYGNMDDELLRSNIHLHSTTTAWFARFELQRIECDLFVGARGIEKFTIRKRGTTTQVTLD
jgi:hypothetical protein